ncbi:MAG TPA: hypothetical protein VJP80_04390 [Candidatus Saccharimonadales bacterium]|nr:hypothetical protein [Candidatus Saccharimonadales bacterium]
MRETQGSDEHGFWHARRYEARYETFIGDFVVHAFSLSDGLSDTTVGHWIAGAAVPYNLDEFRTGVEPLVSAELVEPEDGSAGDIQLNLARHFGGHELDWRTRHAVRVLTQLAAELSATVGEGHTIDAYPQIPAYRHSVPDEPLREYLVDTCGFSPAEHDGVSRVVDAELRGELAFLYGTDAAAIAQIDRRKP